MAWVNAIIQGVLTGGLYALFACGLSLMFGVMKVVNLAHGDLAVVAGYIAIGVITVTHVPVLWSVLIVVPVMAVLGYVLQRTVIQGALDRSVLTTLLVTFGLSVVIENGSSSSPPTRAGSAPGCPWLPAPSASARRSRSPTCLSSSSRSPW
jgi:branched-chain amino acid transport system permease protein